jgi:HSP20 family protein
MAEDRFSDSLPGGSSSVDTDPWPWRSLLRSSGWRPPTDVYETAQAYVVRVEIAGMREDDFIIELDGRILAIRGVRPDVNERRAFHLMEIRFGEFALELELPGPVSEAEVSAVYTNGMLRIILPKTNQEFPREE